MALLATAGADLASGQGSRLRAAVHGKGATVASVQRALGVPADGIYGPRTAAAVRRFQARRGLDADGVVGPLTLAALGGRAAAAAVSGDGAASVVSAPARTGKLQQIARCESGGNPSAVSPGGQYRGKYQFSRATWKRLGGKGDPARAAEAEQDRIAAKLLAQSGTSAWPSCG